MKLIKGGAKQKDLKWVLDFVTANGGIDYARSKGDHYAEQARASLDSFEHSPAKEALLNLVDFTTERSS
jgi:octaprenyl-diphosphate synthase